MSKKSHFRGTLDKQHGKVAEALSKSASQHIYPIHWPLISQLSLTCQILGLLVNTLAADEKYTALNRDNLTILIQMPLSHKKITFSQFFAPFMKPGLNFEHFDKNDEPHRFCNFEITDCENVVR